MTHYTQNTILEEVTSDSFERMKDYWNLTSLRTNSRAIQARIRNPLTWPLCQDKTKPENYYSFLEFLMQDDWLDEIRIRQGGSWVKNYVRRMTRTEMADLAGIVSRATILRNYFEIRFKDPGIRGHVDRVFMEFREHVFSREDIRIVGYHVKVPPDYAHLFNTAITGRNSSTIQGLWLPESVRLPE